MFRNYGRPKMKFWHSSSCNGNRPLELLRDFSRPSTCANLSRMCSAKTTCWWRAKAAQKPNSKHCKYSASRRKRLYVFFMKILLPNLEKSNWSAQTTELREKLTAAQTEAKDAKEMFSKQERYLNLLIKERDGLQALLVRKTRTFLFYF